MSLSFQSAGINEFLALVKDVPANIDTISYQAINKGLTSGRSDAARRITSQINFPASYLGAGTDSSSRLRIASKASSNNLSGTISARVTPTSLARFATADAKGQNVRVRVKGGSTGTFMKGAFIIRLRSGQGITDDNFNLGLAFRVPKGQTLRSSFAARQISSGLYLLYGPSVAQAFNVIIEKDNFTPATASLVSAEFIRLFQLRYGS